MCKESLEPPDAKLHFYAPDQCAQLSNSIMESHAHSDVITALQSLASLLAAHAHRNRHIDPS
jgi:hypothetical protein